MLPKHNNDFCWYNNLEECKPHYTPVKIFSILQFFTLKPRASALTRNNVIQLDNIAYAYKAPTEEKYYLKRFRNYTYDEMLSSDDEAIKVLRQRIEAGHVWLMLTLQNISDTTEMLKRVWNGHYSEKGKMDYRDFINLLKLSLQLEEYKEIGKNLTGYRTVCKGFEDQIKAIWQKGWDKK